MSKWLVVMRDHDGFTEELIVDDESSDGAQEKVEKYIDYYKGVDEIVGYSFLNLSAVPNISEYKLG